MFRKSRKGPKISIPKLKLLIPNLEHRKHSFDFKFRNLTAVSVIFFYPQTQERNWEIDRELRKGTRLISGFQIKKIRENKVLVFFIAKMKDLVTFH